MERSSPLLAKFAAFINRRPENLQQQPDKLKGFVNQAIVRSLNTRMGVDLLMGQEYKAFAEALDFLQNRETRTTFPNTEEVIDSVNMLRDYVAPKLKLDTIQCLALPIQGLYRLQVNVRFLGEPGDVREFVAGLRKRGYNVRDELGWSTLQVELT
jgi:hypothetical protein